MCSIDWGLVADLLTGFGTLLVGFAAVVVLPKQLGYKARRRNLTRKRTCYTGVDDGRVPGSTWLQRRASWADYPDNADEMSGGLPQNRNSQNDSFVSSSTNCYPKARSETKRESQECE